MTNPSAERTEEGRINRRALVTRHNVTISDPTPLAPLSVGNGSLAFTTDVTGLQTFPEFYEDGTPLHTQSHWGWHRTPTEAPQELEDTFASYEVDGRDVPYASEQDTAAGEWLRANPHRLDLGRLGLLLETDDSGEASIDDLTGVDQILDLWRGRLGSEFVFDGEPVCVETIAHPETDAVAIQIESPLLATEQLGVRLSFPYGSSTWRGTADWSSPARHQTNVEIADGTAAFERVLDETSYRVVVAHSAGEFESSSDDSHAY